MRSVKEEMERLKVLEDIGHGIERVREDIATFREDLDKWWMEHGQFKLLPGEPATVAFLQLLNAGAAPRRDEVDTT